MDTIRVDDAPGLRRITLDRPEKRNALSDLMRRELHTAVREVADDPGCRVVVLAGAGPSFSVGADLADPASLLTGEWAERRHAAGGWQRLLDDVESLPQVTVAQLHGHVIGGAALLAVACDLRVAAPDARVSLPEVMLGIPLTWAGIPRLVREIGLPRTRDMVMTGRVVEAPEALAFGLVQRVADGQPVGDVVDALVEELLSAPAAPLAMTKAFTAALGRAVGGHASAWADPDLIAWSVNDPEALEALRSYRQRRR